MYQGSAYLPPPSDHQTMTTAKSSAMAQQIQTPPQGITATAAQANLSNKTPIPHHHYIIESQPISSKSRQQVVATVTKKKQIKTRQQQVTPVISQRLLLRISKVLSRVQRTKGRRCSKENIPPPWLHMIKKALNYKAKKLFLDEIIINHIYRHSIYRLLKSLLIYSNLSLALSLMNGIYLLVFNIKGIEKRYDCFVFQA